MSRARDLANTTTALLVDGTVKLDGNYPTGSNNTALGDTALDDGSFSGGNNVAIGNASMTATTSGNFNTAVGAFSLDANTTGSSNVAVGEAALGANTTGGSNTALGQAALLANTTASNNTAVGYQAGYANNTGTENTLVGRQAGYATTGNLNTIIGSLAGYTNTSGQENCYVGGGAGYLATGSYNTFVGRGFSIAAGSAMTTGSKNTILGAYTGNQGGLDIRTSSNNIVLSDGDGNPRASYTTLSGGYWRFGHTESTNNNDGTVDGVTIAQAGYMVVSHAGGSVLNLNSRNTTPLFISFRNGSSNIGSVSTNQSTVSYNTSSDYRLKENVVELTDATDRIKQIPVHRFNFIADPDRTVDGFLAHEVQAIVPEAIHGTKDEVDEDGNPVYQGIDQSKLVPLLTAAIKEQQALIEDLQTRLAALEAV